MANIIVIAASDGSLHKKAFSDILANGEIKTEYISDWSEATANFVKEDELEDYATTSDLDDYAKTEQLDDYATKESLDDYAKKSDLEEYVTESDLDSYVNESDLPNGFISSANAGISINNFRVLTDIQWNGSQLIKTY